MKTPTNVVHNGKSVRKPKKLSETFNKFFKTKVEKIRDTFDNNNNQVISLLKELVKKPEEKFKFKETTPEEVYKIILN